MDTLNCTRLIACLTALALMPGIRADAKLPTIFSDHMVLQQEIKVPIWGWADAGEKVTVTIGDHTATTTAGADGKWRVDLAPFPDGTAPVTIVVEAKNKLIIQDVLIGDVWLASGQSNMEAALAYAHNGQTEVPKAKDPQLRLFMIARTSSLHPLEDVVSPWPWWTISQKDWKKTPEDKRVDGPGAWVVCAPDAATRFSGVAYFFGKELRGHLKRPIGLIESAWGGSAAQAWTSLPALQKDPSFLNYLETHQKFAKDYPKLNADYATRLSDYNRDFKTWGELQTPYNAAMKLWEEQAQHAKAANQPVPAKPKPPEMTRPQKPALPDGGSQGPANLFNGMIAPLVPFAIKGVIWYQGESNCDELALEYQSLFARLIGDWREQWHQGDFPFIYVQISHFAYLKEESAPLVREAQLKTLETVPNTGMAVTVDIRQDDAAHPRDKEDVGKRLALAARHVAYGENLDFSGPLYKSSKIDGNQIAIEFTHAEQGLMIGSSPYQPPDKVPFPTDKLIGFRIAGTEGIWVVADAKINDDKLVVSSAKVKAPVAVRYAWENSPDCNLYNKAGLPASPFRTDTWEDLHRLLVPKGGAR